MWQRCRQHKRHCHADRRGAQRAAGTEVMQGSRWQQLWSVMGRLTFMQAPLQANVSW